MIELVCVGGPLNGQRLTVSTSESYFTSKGEAVAEPPFGSGYYAPRNRTIADRVERVLRWEGEL